MQSVLSLLESDLEVVDSIIKHNLNSSIPQVKNIGDYLVNAGGKRLRPILSLLIGHALNADLNKIHQLSATVEFIHTATLLHDDVVDESDMRRGRPTANAEFGNAQAVLVGDFIYSRAFQLMVELENIHVMRILSETTNRLAEGEVMQLVNAGDTTLSEDEYYKVIRAKTAKLFEAACLCSAHFQDNPSQQSLDAFKTYGDQLGISFQLVDDLLDYIGDAQAMGKNIGDDLAEGKATLPLIHTMANAPEQDALIIKLALENKDTSRITEVVEIVNRHGSLDYTRDAAINAANNAKQALNFLDDTPFKEALLEICDYCVARTL